MSMSQEEIESLMNGLDLAEDSASEVASEGEVAVEDVPAEEAPVSEEPVAVEPAVEEVVEEEAPTAEPEEESSVEEATESETVATMDNSDIDDLINNLDVPDEATEEATEDATVSTDDIDELLASIDAPSETEESTQVESAEIDDLLASLDDVQEETIANTVEETVAPVVADEPAETPVEETPEVEDKAKDMAINEVEDKIQKGVFPLPAEPESKVVTQLSAVANDSEEKATKIFDVLSLILDENYKVETSVKKIEEFLKEQEKVLQTLTAKFPNVDVFKSNLQMLNDLKDEPQNIKDIINNENNELFSAMELMQYHDINRQKIERVMSVIRKLTIYLNNIFEDDNSHEEIVVAKHISGDNTEDLVGDEDLDALIAEFGN